MIKFHESDRLHTHTLSLSRALSLCLCLYSNQTRNFLLVGLITLLTVVLCDTHRHAFIEIQEHREVAHFQYEEWPDHGTPHNTTRFRELLASVDAELPPTNDVILVHCRYVREREWRNRCDTETLTKSLHHH
jgi:hypothetical protein